MQRRTPRQRGFTLIELLVVIMIIGLLTAAAATSFVNAQRSARDNARKTTINTLATGIETYYSSKKVFPGNIDTATGSGVLSPGMAHPNTASYNTEYAVCSRIDTDSAAPSGVSVPNGGAYGTYLYYYAPSDASLGTHGCDETSDNTTTVNSVVVNNFLKADFTPYPSWIPGLGAYVNPMPIDKKFQDSAGLDYDSVAGSAGGPAMTCDMTQQLNSVPCAVRTYAYRHLVGGYALYTRLETNVIDKDTVPANTAALGGQPALPSDIAAVTTTNIYMVRR